MQWEGYAWTLNLSCRLGCWQRVDGVLSFASRARSQRSSKVHSIYFAAALVSVQVFCVRCFVLFTRYWGIVTVLWSFLKSVTAWFSSKSVNDRHQVSGHVHKEWSDVESVRKKFVEKVIKYGQKSSRIGLVPRPLLKFLRECFRQNQVGQHTFVIVIQGSVDPEIWKHQLSQLGNVNM